MKQRLEYIDALRRLAILLVVFMHVPQLHKTINVE